MTDENRLVGRLLDEGLKRYGEVEPRPGMESRILARLAVEPDKKVRPWWIWVPLCTSVAALAIVMVVHQRPIEVPVARRAEVARVESASVVKGAVESATDVPVPPQRAGAGMATAAARKSGRHLRASLSEPRRDLFFSGDALSEQERALLKFVASASAQELEAIAKQQHEAVQLGSLREWREQPARSDIEQGFTPPFRGDFETTRKESYE